MLVRGYFYLGITDNNRLYLARWSTNPDFTVVILDFSNYLNLVVYGPSFDTATFGQNVEINSASVCIISISCFVVSIFSRKLLKKKERLNEQK